jgi:hypothetical protein
MVTDILVTKTGFAGAVITERCAPEGKSGKRAEYCCCNMDQAGARVLTLKEKCTKGQA